MREGGVADHTAGHGGGASVAEPATEPPGSTGTVVPGASEAERDDSTDFLRAQAAAAVAGVSAGVVAVETSAPTAAAVGAEGAVVTGAAAAACATDAPGAAEAAAPATVSTHSAPVPVAGMAEADDLATTSTLLAYGAYIETEDVGQRGEAAGADRGAVLVPPGSLAAVADEAGGGPALEPHGTQPEAVAPPAPVGTASAAPPSPLTFAAASARPRTAIAASAAAPGGIQTAPGEPAGVAESSVYELYSRGAESSIYIEAPARTLPERQRLYTNSVIAHDAILDQHFRTPAHVLRQHHFWDLVEQYRVSRVAVKMSKEKVAELNRAVSATVDGTVWEIRPSETQESGKCKCGTKVSSVRAHETAAFLPRAHAELKGLLEERRSHYSTSMIEAISESRIARLHVEAYLGEATHNTGTAGEAGPRQQQGICNVSFVQPDVRDEQAVARVRESIEILVLFCRGACKDSGFIFELSGWLEHLSAYVLTVASLDDHRFLMHTLLRSGRGMSEALVCVVQFPADPSMWNTGMVDHAIASLHVLFSHPTNPDNTADHTSGFLSDSDYVALLERIPLATVLACTLHNSGSNTHHVPRMFALVECVLEVLRGMFTDPVKAAYLSLATRAGRIISEIFAAVGELWEDELHNEAREAGNYADRETVHSFQVELDFLFFRTIRWFVQDPHHAVWPFVAEFPFRVVSGLMGWRILCLIFTGGEVTLGCDPYTEWLHVVKDPTYRARFEDALLLQPARTAGFMLSTVASLASLRSGDSADDDLMIESVCIELFSIGCLSPRTREVFLRTARDLLIDLATQHPSVVSVLLRLMNTTFDLLGKVSMYLVRSIPILDWQPSPDDLDILHRWLRLPSTSHEHLAARIIVEGISSRGYEDNTSVTTPAETHRDAALIIVSAFVYHKREDRTVDIPAAVVRVLPTSEMQLFTNWCWQQLLKLNTWGCTHFDYVSASCLDVIKVAAAEPLVAYALLSISSVGRLWSEFITLGLQLITTIAEAGKHDAVVRILQDAVPIFVASPGGLTAVSEHQDFTALMTTLVGTDLSVMAMVSKLATTPVKVEDVLVKTITIHMFHGTGMIPSASDRTAPSATRTQLVEFWMRALCGINDCHVIPLTRRLIGVVCAAAFLEDESRMTVQSLLDRYHSVATTAAKDRRKDIRKGIGGVFHWLANTVQYDGDILSFCESGQGYDITALQAWLTSSVKSDKQQNAILAKYQGKDFNAILVYESLVMETRKESDARKMLAQMLLSTERGEKATPDTGAKALKQHVESFRIYRWAFFCCNIDPSEPLMPLYWQMFFAMYFETFESTKPKDAGRKQHFGHLMFSGSRELIKQQLRLRLDLIVDWHREQERANRQCNPPNDTVTAFNLQLIELYGAMKSWLSGARPVPFLLESGVDLRTTETRYRQADMWLCSAAYDTPWNSQNSHKLWRQFVDHSVLAGNLSSSLRLGSNEQSQPRRTKPKTVPRAKGEVLSRLLRAPVETAVPNMMPTFTSSPVDCQMTDDEPQAYVNIMASIRQDLTVLQNAAIAHATKFASLAVLDEDYLEALPSLFVNDTVRVAQQVVCNKLLGQPCDGPAELIFLLQQQRMVTSVQSGLSHNRQEVNRIMHDVPVAEEVCQASFRTQCRIAAVVACCADRANSRETARVLFYSILDMMNKTDTLFYPTRTVFEWVVRTLGEAVIAQSAREMRPLLDVCVAKPHHTFLLAQLFHPNLCTETFPILYETAASRTLVEPQFIEPLLECFDVTEWLTHGCPTYSNRRDMISKLGTCIEVCVNHLLPASRSECLQRQQWMHELNLQALAEHRFPSHYADVLNLLVDSCTRYVVPETCWSRFLDILDGGEAGQSFLPPLTPEQVSESIQWLSRKFADIRTSNSCLFVIFVQRTTYLSRLFLLLLKSAYTAVNHEALDSSHSFDPSSASIPIIFGSITHLYSPWFSSTSAAGTAELPWSQDSDATAMSNMLASLVGFVQRIRPVSTAMAYFWSFYTTILAPNAIAHVLSLVHATVISMAWSEVTFGTDELGGASDILDADPSTTSHLFLSSVFCKLRWTDGPDGADEQSLYFSRLLECFLKMSSNRSVAQSVEEFKPLLDVVQQQSWQMLPADGYERAAGYFESVCNVNELFVRGSQASHSLAVLRAAVGLSPHFVHGAGLRMHKEKFGRYASTYAALLLQGKSRVSPSNVCWVFKEMLADIQMAVQLHDSTDQNVGRDLLRSAFCMFNIHEAGSPHMKILVDVICSVSKQQPGWALPILSASCLSMASIPDMIKITECCMDHHFAINQAKTSVEKVWETLQSHLYVPELNYAAFVDACLSGPHILTLYAHLLQLLSRCSSLTDEESVLDSLTQWVAKLHPNSTTLDEKILLLWVKVIQLTERQLSLGSSTRRLTHILANLLDPLSRVGEDRDSRGLLGTFGIGSKSAYHVKMRLACRVIAASTAANLTRAEFDVISVQSPQARKIRAGKYLQQLANTRKPDGVYASLHAHADMAYQYILTCQSKHGFDTLGLIGRVILGLYDGSEFPYLYVIGDMAQSSASGANAPAFEV